MQPHIVTMAIGDTPVRVLDLPGLLKTKQGLRPISTPTLKNRSATGMESCGKRFVHVMPELHGARGAVAEAVYAPLPYGGISTYFLALLGFLAFYALEHVARRLQPSGEGHEEAAFRLHLHGAAHGQGRALRAVPGRRPALRPGPDPARLTGELVGMTDVIARHRNRLIAGWLFAYRREWLRADLAAGLTAAAVVIPKAMAYAVVAGLAVEVGLYTALAALLVYPLFGSSRPLSVTTTSAIAMLTAAQVVATATRNTGTDAATVAATLALLVGGLLLLARLLRLGFLANFISKPVLVGFEAGVGLVLIIGQLHAALGVKVASHTAVGTMLELPALLAQTQAVTVGVALAGIAILVMLPRLLPRVSAPLVWVALSIAATALFDLGALGVKLVGVVPPGLPTLGLPALSLVSALWPAALGIALMSFTESVAAARTFCQRDDAPVDANRELLAVGAANLASAVVGGLPAGGGASQTGIIDGAGARSPLAQWVNAAAVLVTLLFLSPVIALLPQAALAALILVAAAGMIRREDFRAIARVRRDEWAWALATLAGVVLVGTLEGILIAVAISLLTLLYQANHPPVYAVTYNRALRIFRPAGEDQADEAPNGLLMLRTEGRLTFANATNAGEKMQALVRQAGPRVIVLECSAIPDIEYTALLMLTEAEQKLRAHGVELWLAAVNPGVRRILERSPLGATLGAARLHPNLLAAFEAYRSRGALPVSMPAGEGSSLPT